jgi:hypothetical protein
MMWFRGLVVIESMLSKVEFHMMYTLTRLTNTHILYDKDLDIFVQYCLSSPLSFFTLAFFLLLFI